MSKKRFICSYCDKEYYLLESVIKNRNSRGGSKYCSKECKVKAQIGRSRSKETVRKMSKSLKGRKSWRKGLKGIWTGNKNPNWKGGICKHSCGYILLLRPNHLKSDKRGYVRRSIIVAESIIKRNLTKSELIHHIDANKSNDNPDNLYLFSSNSEHMSYEGLKNKPLLKSNL